MKKSLPELKVGDKVYMDCQVGCSMGASSTGYVTIKAFKTKYNESTGKPYPVIVIEGGQEFHGEKGYAITTPWAYLLRLTDTFHKV